MHACPCVELHLIVWVITMALACYTCFALNLSVVCTVVASDTHISLYTYKSIYTRSNFKICKFKKGSNVKKLCEQGRDQTAWKQVEDTAQGLLYNENKF